MLYPEAGLNAQRTFCEGVLAALDNPTCLAALLQPALPDVHADTLLALLPADVRKVGSVYYIDLPTADAFTPLFDARTPELTLIAYARWPDQTVVENDFADPTGGSAKALLRFDDGGLVESLRAVAVS